MKTDDDEVDKMARFMRRLAVTWLLFVAGAVCVALFIFGRWVGVW